MLERIAIIRNQLNSYSEPFIDAHVRSLPFDIHVLGGHRPPRTSVTTGEDFTGKVTSLPKRVWNRLMRFATRQSEREIQDKNIRNYLVKHRIQLLLAEYGNTAAEIIDVSEALNIPLVVHFHGYDAYSKALLSKYSVKYQKVFSYASAIVVVSRDMERQVLALGAPKEKVFYNVYGVDIKRFQPGNVNQSSDLLAVGRFVDKKAPHLTILAFSKMLQKDPVCNSKLIMVGDGVLLEACMQLAKALKIGDRVVFKGVRPHEEVSAIMRSCRAFVQHSLTTSTGDSEGTPNTILEASASGIPVISTRHGGILDVVKDLVTGFLVAEGDVDGMADAMGALIRNADKAAQMGLNSRKLVESQFSLDESITRLANIINNAYLAK